MTERLLRLRISFPSYSKSHWTHPPKEADLRLKINVKGASKSLASNSPNFLPALRDNRIQLVRSTPHELSISISNVALADEGEYTCSIFTMPVRTAKSLVTVLGEAPKPQYHHSMLSCKQISLGGPLKVPRAKQVFKPFGKVQPMFSLQWNKIQRALSSNPFSFT